VLHRLSELYFDTTFSLEMCLVLSPDTDDLTEYLFGERLVPTTANLRDDIFNPDAGETPQNSPEDACSSVWVSGMTRHRERGGMHDEKSIYMYVYTYIVWAPRPSPS
jgi:hypothetical protein